MDHWCQFQFTSLVKQLKYPTKSIIKIQWKSEWCLSNKSEIDQNQQKQMEIGIPT